MKHCICIVLTSSRLAFWLTHSGKGPERYHRGNISRTVHFQDLLRVILHKGRPSLSGETIVFILNKAVPKTTFSQSSSFVFSWLLRFTYSRVKAQKLIAAHFLAATVVPELLDISFGPTYSTHRYTLVLSQFHVLSRQRRRYFAGQHQPPNKCVFSYTNTPLRLFPNSLS